jgi:8-oxo-dGTP pyrophosphatase MutT (NUDIX family)
MPWNSSFQIEHNQKTIHLIDTRPELQRQASDIIIAAFSEVITKTIDTDTFEILHGRHSEPYLILGANQFCHLERFAHSLFGIVARGAHLTAYTCSSSGVLKIWVPRRARHLFTYPGKLDSTVAGGVKATDTPFECIIAEAQEEASLDESLVRERVRSVGTLTYMTMYDSPLKRETGLISPEVLYVYDMELPESVVLKPCDDEVEQFYLMSVEEVKSAMQHGEFKTNSAVVMIDFFVRHGIITQENEPAFVEIISRMHRRLPIATAASNPA